jgi:AcrR family transcriptional regulator
MPRGVQRSGMRQELLLAAASIIESDGIDALTVQSVTVAAACAKGVLYNYFDDLDDLVAELVADSLSATIRDIRGVIDASADPIDKVLETIAMLIVGERNVRIATAAFQRPGVVQQVMSRFADHEAPNLATITSLIATYLAAEITRGRVVATADTNTLAYLFVTALHDQLQRGLGSPKVPDPKQLVAALFGPVIRKPATRSPRPKTAQTPGDRATPSRTKSART